MNSSRKVLCALTLLGAFVPGVLAQTSATVPALSLPQAVELALRNNPTVQAADAYAEAVEQGIAVARAGRFPRLDFSESFTRSNNPVYVFGSLLTQRQFTAANFALDFLNTPPPLNNFRTQFAAAVPLYDAGQTSGRIRDARLEAQSAAQGRQRTRQEVIFQVVRAYTSVMLARESERVAQAAVDTAEADLVRSQARDELGLAIPSDTLSAQVQLAQAREDLLRAQNEASVARAALNVTLGVSEDAPTSITGQLAETTFELGALADRQSRALASRPDYLRAELGKQQAANGLRMARTSFLPQLNLFSAWEMDNQTFASRGGNNWTVGASLNFNIFDGGANRARLAASRARERQMEALKAQMASQVRLQVHESYLNVTTARGRVEVSRVATSQAEESLRILQDRYQAGLATITDLLRAETALTSARRNFLNALYDYRLSFAALELATGELAADSQAATR